MKKSGRSRHCFCLGDGDGFMICCDFSQVWYHGRCVKVSEGVAKNVNQWFCKHCVETRQSHKQVWRVNYLRSWEGLGSVSKIDQIKATLKQEKEEELSSQLILLREENSKMTLELENMMKEKEAISMQFEVLKQELEQRNSTITLDLVNMTKEKLELTSQLILLTEENSKMTVNLQNIMKEKEAISLQLAALKQAENNELKELKAENTMLKECVKRSQNRSRLSLKYNKKQ